MKDGVLLLDDFNMNIFRGEIMGLLCLNNHGRDELISLVCRNEPIDYGRIYFCEELANSYQHSSFLPNRAAVISPQSRLVEDLTVADNVFVLRSNFHKYLINSAELEGQFDYLKKEIGVDISGAEYVRNLSAFERCTVELIKAVATGARLVILLDMNNTISASELARFQGYLHFYASRKNISFLYLCNHHQESVKVCDRISLMENGHVLFIKEKKDFNEDIVWHYCWNFAGISASGRAEKHSEPVLEFRDVSTENMNHLSFSAAKGECIGLWDLDNKILKEIMQTMSRDFVPESGEILLSGDSLQKISAKATFLKAAFINEDPVRTMIYKDFNVIQNLYFLLDEREKIRPFHSDVVKSIYQEYEPLMGTAVYANDVRLLPLRSLYDIVYYRVHLLHPNVVFIMQPFYNADMYLREHIIQLLNELKKHGIAIVLLSINVSDMLFVVDRLLQVEGGTITHEYDSSEFSSIQSLPPRNG